MRKTLKDIGEREFLSLIEHLIDNAALDFNDDSSAIELPSGEILVINADMLVKKTDVLPGMTSAQIGKKAVTMALSDIIVKGATPIGCLSSVGFPPDLSVVEAEQIVVGVKEQCTKFNVLFLGGDLNESSDLILDSIVFGLCKKENLIPRKGAKNNDLIYSTGLFGFTSIGYKILLHDYQIEGALRDQALFALYEPTTRLDFIHFLLKSNVKISMDCSDGLSLTLQDLSRINKLGINIEYVPIHPLVETASKKHSLNPLDLVFNGGEEFEMIFAISPDNKLEVEKIAKKLNLTIYKLGVFTTDHEKIIIEDSRFKDVEFNLKGFNHFR